VKLAKDIEVGDELAGYGSLGTLEHRRVVQVQRFPGGDVWVTWDLGGKVYGMGLFGPDQEVPEFADEMPEARGR
jgi:hypothetical protein